MCTTAYYIQTMLDGFVMTVVYEAVVCATAFNSVIRMGSPSLYFICWVVFLVPTKILLSRIHALDGLTLLRVIREQIERILSRQGDRLGYVTIGHAAVVDTGILVVHS